LCVTGGAAIETRAGSRADAFAVCIQRHHLDQPEREGTRRSVDAVTLRERSAPSADSAAASKDSSAVRASSVGSRRPRSQRSSSRRRAALSLGRDGPRRPAPIQISSAFASGAGARARSHTRSSLGSSESRVAAQAQRADRPAAGAPSSAGVDARMAQSRMLGWLHPSPQDPLYGYAARMIGPRPFPVGTGRRLLMVVLPERDRRNNRLRSPSTRAWPHKRLDRRTTIGGTLKRDRWRCLLMADCQNAAIPRIASVTRPTSGRVAASSGGLKGIGQKRDPTRVTGASRCWKSCSTILATTSAPTP
jgi:hypothetical protein